MDDHPRTRLQEKRLLTVEVPSIAVVKDIASSETDGNSTVVDYLDNAAAVHFPSDEANSYEAASPRTSQEDNITSNVPTAIDDNSNDEYDKSNDSVYDDIVGNLTNAATDALRSLNFRFFSSLTQNASSASSSTSQDDHLPSLPTYTKQEVKRRHVAHEILTTEQSYFAGLVDLEQLYVAPLRATTMTTTTHNSMNYHNTYSAAPTSPSPSLQSPFRQTYASLPYPARNSLTVSTGNALSPSTTAAIVAPSTPTSPLWALANLLQSNPAPATLLPKQTVNEIFSNVDDIIRINRELLNMLEERLADPSKPWDPKTGELGDIFLSLAPFLKVYSVYIKNFPRALNVISASMRNHPRFNTWIHSVKAPSSNPGSERLPGFLCFQSYLILPIQRIPRYRMLLSSLLDSTPDSHVDHAALTKAFHLIDGIASWVNETVRQHEDWMRMLEVRRVLVGLPTMQHHNNKKGGSSSNKPTTGLPGDSVVAAHRRFIKRGQVTKICRKSNQLREFFLFSDMLIYASQTLGSSTFNFHRKFDLESLTVVDLPDTDQDSEDATMPRNSFHILTPTKSFQVFVATAKQKTEWIDAFTGARAALQSARDSIRQPSLRRQRQTIAQQQQHNTQQTHQQGPRHQMSLRQRRTATMYTQLELDISGDASDDDEIHSLSVNLNENEDDNRRQECPNPPPPSPKVSRRASLSDVNDITTLINRNCKSPFLDDQDDAEMSSDTDSEGSNRNSALSVTSSASQPKNTLSSESAPKPSPALTPKLDSDTFRAPVWIPDGLVSQCKQCQLAFSFLTRRKHHCRACGNVVCNDCSRRRFIPPESNSPERCCDACWSMLFVRHVDASHSRRHQQQQAQKNRMSSTLVRSDSSTSSAALSLSRTDSSGSAVTKVGLAKATSVDSAHSSIMSSTLVRQPSDLSDTTVNKEEDNKNMAEDIDAIYADADVDDDDDNDDDNDNDDHLDTKYTGQPPFHHAYAHNRFYRLGTREPNMLYKQQPKPLQPSSMGPTTLSQKLEPRRTRHDTMGRLDAQSGGLLDLVSLQSIYEQDSFMSCVSAHLSQVLENMVD